MRSTLKVFLCISTVLLAFLLFSTLHADNSKLIAHYTFDEGQGDVLKDSSGNGLDGKIVKAEYVKSPRGFALKFIPANQSYVDLGTNPLLNIQGDMSFVAWVKVDTKDLGDKYIFGDSASLAKDRNFYISANNLYIRLEHGNESATEQINSDKPVFNGEWQHMAVICEYPNYYLYINGKQVKFGTMTVPITASPITSHRIGGWWWERGFFNGEIDDIKLYARAISEKEILADYGQPQTTANTEIQKVDVIVHYPLHEVFIQTLCKNVDTDNQKLKVIIYSPSGKKIQSFDSRMSETRSGSERAVSEVWMDAKYYVPGNYKIDVSIIDDKDEIIAKADSVTFNYPKKPEWFGSKEGTSDKVLAPFTPIKVKQNNGKVEVNTWGRSYVVGNSPIFSDIISQGKSIFAGPAEVTCNVASSILASKPIQKAAVKANKSKTSILQKFSTQNKNAQIEIRTNVGYDGFAKVDFKLIAAKDTSLNQLKISFPLNGKYAKLFYSYLSSINTNNGALNGVDRSIDFRPLIWIGDEEKGVSWMAESDQNWNPADINKAIEVKHQNGKVYLTLNIVERSIELKKNKPITYTFALQATPVKPIIKDVWDMRFHHIAQGTLGPREIVFDFPDETFDKVAALGTKTAIIHEHWTPYQGYSKTNDEAGLHKFVEQWHKRNIKLLLYFGFNVSDLMPEWPYIGEDVVIHPKSGYIPYNYPPQPLQNAYVCCYNSVYQDLVVDGIAKLVDNFDIDGVYLDTTVAPFGCTNTLHGCGYIAPDGTLKPTYPVFAVRNLLKRMYHVIKERKPDGQIDAHVYDAMNIAALAWATSYWNGEQLTQLPKDPYYPNMLSLSRFRTEFMGYNWGIPADLLFYGLGDHKKVHALSLLHDIPVRGHGLNDMTALESSLWKLMDAYDRKNSRWFPYWKNSDYVAISPADCYVSFRLHPKNGILAFVSNLSKETQTISVKFDYAKLSKTLGKNVQFNPSTAIDALTNEQLNYSNGTVSFELPTIGWKAIWIK